MTAERLLGVISCIVARYPHTIIKCITNFPHHSLIFIEGEDVVAQVCVETGDFTIKDHEE